jgi:hypothetical protein
MGHLAHRGRKIKAEPDSDPSGSFGVCPSAAVVAGAWMILEKKLRTENKINIHNQVGGDDLKITAEDLARTLTANDLVLIGDGERFKVIKT